jgi:hypothetical protein
LIFFFRNTQATVETFKTFTQAIFIDLKSSGSFRSEIILDVPNDRPASCVASLSNSFLDQEFDKIKQMM